MNKRQGFAPILLIILALVISVGGVGIGLAWKTEVLDKILPPNIKEFFGKEVTPTNGEQPATDGEEPTGEDQQPTVEDQTKDWKTYTNSQYGYSFKYPSGWVVSLRTSSEIKLGNPDSRALEGFDIYGLDQGASLLYENSGDKSAEEFASDLLNRYSNPEVFPTTVGSVSLGGRTWGKATVDGGGMQYALRDVYYTVVREGLGFYFNASAEVDDNGNLVHDYDKTELEILELMVSSFRFTD